MTVQTSGEFPQQFGVMRGAVTLGAIGNQAMPLMTVGAGHLAMLAFGVAPGSVDLRVTGPAGRGVLGAVSDFQRFMHRVAGQTLANLLSGQMGLMAFHAGWNIAVPVMVAFPAGDICLVFAWELRHFSGRAGVAGSAG